MDFTNLPNGVCNAILQPHVERFNMIAKMDRFADITGSSGEYGCHYQGEIAAVSPFLFMDGRRGGVSRET